MICAEFFKKGGKLVGFSISGHSGAACSGRDIVCAAVSSAAYLTANTVTDVIGVKAGVSAGGGRMELTVPDSGADKCAVTLKGFRLHMEGLRKQYPEYLHVHDTEV